jgi:competence protein ComEA
MADAPPNTGITTSPAPTAATAPDIAAPPIKKSEPVPTWPLAAQRVTAGLLAVALCLLGWQSFGVGRLATKPTTLEPGATAFRVDLNHADHAHLLQLPGVGEALAGRIEDYRQSYGGFRSVDDLVKVGGIGPATLERLRPFVYAQVDESEDDEDAAPASPRIGFADRRNDVKPGPSKAPISKKAKALAGPLDLNRATAEELQRLPGVGLKMSARIIAAREEKPFRTVDDLRRVSGIGAKTLEHLRPWIVVGPGPPAKIQANDGSSP